LGPAKRRDIVNAWAESETMKRVNVVPYGLLAALFAACSVFTREVPTDDSPPGGPEAACFKACTEKVPNCRRSQCARGCNLILDRLAEHEGAGVLACVAHVGGPCDDRAWAHCGARVGAHADGGPPGPAPARDDIEE
jgi:hypothetical protein